MSLCVKFMIKSQNSKSQTKKVDWSYSSNETFGLSVGLGLYSQGRIKLI